MLTSEGWRVNLRGRSEVEVTLRGRRSRAVAALICEQGYDEAGRRMGIRINLDRVPTQEELVDAARRDNLSLIYLQVSGIAR